MSAGTIDAQMSHLEALLMARRPAVTLHPNMTALQIAEWCQRHKMCVTIDYMTGVDGCLQPLIQARREVPEGHVPAFLKRQAE